MSLSLTGRVANGIQDVLDIVLDIAELHCHLLHRSGGGHSIRRRRGGNDGVLFEFLRQGVYSSFESCCLFPGCAVGFAQRGAFALGCIHLLQQVVHLAVEVVVVVVLFGLVFDHSLFDFDAALFVSEVHLHVVIGDVCHYRVCGGRIACVRDYHGVFITSTGLFISSIKGKVKSIIRRVHKSLERVPRGFGAWGVELAMFGRHFA
jgi:hypothetical protein